MLTLDQLFLILKNQPERIVFGDVITLIDTLYDFTPQAFYNGDLLNQAGENNGSCKLFFFAQQQQLSERNTLYCFGEHYQNVLEHPEDSNHANIRQFMKTGWDGINYQGRQALTRKVNSCR